MLALLGLVRRLRRAQVSSVPEARRRSESLRFLPRWSCAVARHAMWRHSMILVLTAIALGYACGLIIAALEGSK